MMANEKIKTTNPKCKDWEKRRRDKLGDAFKLLAQLLPHHDPAKLPSRIHILNRATEFIKELRLSNSRLLSAKTQPNEMSIKIQELQDEVNKLVLRVKQLTTLLDQAKIPIPNGPSIQNLGKREFKWSRKLSPEDVENLGFLLNQPNSVKPLKSKKSKVTIHLASISTKSKESKETQQPQLELENGAQSSASDSKVNSGPAKVVKETLGPESELINDDDITASAKASLPNDDSGLVEQNVSKSQSKSDITYTDGSPNLLTNPVHPKTQISVTDLSNSKANAKSPSTSKNINKSEPSSMPGKDSITLNAGTMGSPKKIPMTLNPSLSPVKAINLNFPQIIKSSPIILTPLTLYSTGSGGLRTLGPLLPKVQPGVMQKLPITRIKRPFIPKKVRTRKRRKVEVKEVMKTNSSAKEEQVEIPLAPLVPSPKPIEEKSKSPLPEVIDITDEALKENSNNKTPVAVDNNVLQGLNLGEKIVTDKEYIPASVLQQEIDQGVNNGNVTSIPENISASSLESEVCPQVVDPSKQPENKEIDKPKHPDSGVTLGNIHAEQNSETQNKSQQVDESQEPQPEPLPPATLPGRIESIPTPEERSNARNEVFSFVDENASPSSPVKISECIARSIGISMEQDEVESDLMELNTDWTGVVDPSCSQSPKSCISPTQMFLSCFPLLPRDGNINSELPTQVQPSFIKSTIVAPGNARPSSFCINSMLPHESNQDQTFPSIENPFAPSSSLSKKSMPIDSFEKVLAPLQTFKSNKLLPLPSTSFTNPTTSTSSLDLYPDKGLLWFTDFLNPITKDTPTTTLNPISKDSPNTFNPFTKDSASTSFSARPFQPINSSFSQSNPDKHSHQPSSEGKTASGYREHSKDVHKPPVSGNSKTKCSKVHSVPINKEPPAPLRSKEKNQPRIPAPMPEVQPQFSISVPPPPPVNTKTSKSRTPQPQSNITSQNLQPKQRETRNQPYPYQSIEKIIDHQSHNVSNNSEYQRKYFYGRNDQYSTPSSRLPQQPLISGTTNQFQPQPSIPKSISSQGSYPSSSDCSRYTLPSYSHMPQTNRASTSISNSGSFPPPPPPIYQHTSASTTRISSSTAPLYLTPPVHPTCENSTRAVTFPPSAPHANNQYSQMNYSQLAEATYQPDFNTHQNSGTGPVGTNHELNSYFGSTSSTQMQQPTKKQELRAPSSVQISPRPASSLVSNRGSTASTLSNSSQHYHHQRPGPVNWMTESRTGTGSKKGSSRGTSFSVSKLVDQPNTSIPIQQPPAPVPPDKNYYTEVLLSKTSFGSRSGNYNALDWGQPHYSTNTNDNPFMFQNTQHTNTTQNPPEPHQNQHNFQLGFQDTSNQTSSSSSYYTGGNPTPSTHNQQHQGQFGLSTSQYFVDYGHVGQNSINPVPVPSTPYQQNQHHHYHHHGPGSSVSNFNLSSLFPEIETADKGSSKNPNNHLQLQQRNTNNNPSSGNSSSGASIHTQNNPSLNLLDSYSHNNFANIGITPFPTVNVNSGRKHH